MLVRKLTEETIGFAGASTLGTIRSHEWLAIRHDYSVEGDL